MPRIAGVCLSLVMLSGPGIAQDAPLACAAGLAVTDLYFGEGDAVLTAPSGAQPEDGWCRADGIHMDWTQGKWPQRISASEIRWQPRGTDTILVEVTDIRLRLRKGAGMNDLYLGGFLSNVGADLQLQSRYDAATRDLSISPLSVALPGESRLVVSMALTDVDMRSRGALQTSLGSGKLTMADIDLWMDAGFGRSVMSPLITDPEGFEDGLADMRKLLVVLPGTVLAPDSRRAVEAVLSDLPAPKGLLSVKVRSAEGFGASSLMPIILRGVPETPAQWEKALSGLTLDVVYDPTARTGN